MDLHKDGDNQMTLTDAEKAYQRIKEDIVTLKMRPGALIRETDLMEDLEFGRTPIREALKRLQSENLVIASPRRGVRRRYSHHRSDPNIRNKSRVRSTLCPPGRTTGDLPTGARDEGFYY